MGSSQKWYNTGLRGGTHAVLSPSTNPSKEHVMTVLDDLEDLAEEGLCHECSTPLTEEEQEMGYLCLSCIHGWSDENMSNDY